MVATLVAVTGTEGTLAATVLRTLAISGALTIAALRTVATLVVVTLTEGALTATILGTVAIAALRTIAAFITQLR